MHVAQKSIERIDGGDAPRHVLEFAVAGADRRAHHREGARVGPVGEFGRVAFAQARQRDRFVGQRIADRRAQHVEALVFVQRLELLPALAI